MVNLSLQTGYFCETWKTGVVYPLLKNPGLDLPFENFRLISNLQFVSKSDRACGGLSDSVSHNYKINNLFPQLQSAYRSHHSPETALLKVTNDPLMNMDKCRLRTVDHGILLQSPQMKVGVCGIALSWFKSYLEGRSQRICIKETLSQPFDLKWGVPQGSCLGPLLFTTYTLDFFSKC